MKKVFKYKLEVADLQSVTLPKGAKPLCVKLQNGTLCLWALVDLNEVEKETVTIRCAGTGHPIEEDVKDYLGTEIMYGGSLVFHFFTI